MTVARQPVRIMTVEINENNSAFAGWDVLDEQGQAVALVDVDTLTLTLYDDLTNGVINSRDVQSVLNANGGTYHATSGHISMQFEAADNPIVGEWTRGRRESHTALFELSWDSGGGSWSGEIRILVSNLQRVG